MPNLPLFFQPDLTASHLIPEESHHAVSVLRLRIGDPLELTDGRGTFARAELTSDDKKAANYRIIESHQVPRRSRRLHLAIAPTKNIDRMEWLVEKCTEIGVDTLSFIKCNKSERPTVPLDRLRKLALSAMKQSRQGWLPELTEMTPFKDFLQHVDEPQRFIAHVDSSNPNHLSKVIHPTGDAVLLVGPEGDFSNEELELAQQGGFVKVSLGSNRLRTETAGLYGIAAMNIFTT